MTRSVAMLWPVALWAAIRVKVYVWLAHRATTTPGVFYFWKRWRKHPRFWWWFALINAVSLATLFGLFCWVDHARSGH